jgi:hypothetical protein
MTPTQNKPRCKRTLREVKELAPDERSKGVTVDKYHSSSHIKTKCLKELKWGNDRWNPTTKGWVPHPMDTCPLLGMSLIHTTS